MQSLALYVGFGLVTASILCIGAVGFTPVSYTHLTLPTNREV